MLQKLSFIVDTLKQIDRNVLNGMKYIECTACWLAYCDLCKSICHINMKLYASNYRSKDVVPTTKDCNGVCKWCLKTVVS